MSFFQFAVILFELFEFDRDDSPVDHVIRPPAPVNYLPPEAESKVVDFFPGRVLPDVPTAWHS